VMSRRPPCKHILHETPVALAFGITSRSIGPAQANWRQHLHASSSADPHTGTEKRQFSQHAIQRFQGDRPALQKLRSL